MALYMRLGVKSNDAGACSSSTFLRVLHSRHKRGGCPLVSGVHSFDRTPGADQVAYPTALDPVTLAFDWDATHRRVGGELTPLPVPVEDGQAESDGAVALHILVDHSAVEVFTGNGQALATRCADPD